MTSAPDHNPPAARLRRALVLGVTEAECTVFARGKETVMPFADPFPGPRVERVAPGHLVALAMVPGGAELVVWRWFDAVVLRQGAGSITLWEPAHGEVVAEPRDAGRSYRPGARAYLSAGLPGAEWWVAGPAVERAEHADVELDDVERFFAGLGLWDR